MKKAFPIQTIIKTALLVAAAHLITACGGGKGAAGMAAYNIGEFDRAEKLLAKAYQKEKNRYMRGQYAFYLAECYRKKGLNKKAASTYSRAVRYNYRDNNALLYMADCLRSAGDFEEAEEAYAMFLLKSTGNLQAKNGMTSCKMAKEKWDEMTQYDYKNAPDSGYVMHLMRPLNSKFSDYCPAFVGDDYDIVYFTTMRPAKRSRKLNRVTGQGNSNIYMSRLDGRDQWIIPEPLEDPFDAKIDDGTPSLTPDGKTMYFTRCPYNPDNPNNAYCYEVSRSGGRWGEPVRVMPGGDSTMMVAHPAISPDGGTLYFVSDIDGGIGGKDIYSTKRNTDGTWGPAQNLGAIVNTKGDEMFPYVRANGDLYFSSNGHPGYGGLDIYKATLTETGRYEVVNMGVPINSFADDFGIVFKGNREEGMLSSSRANSKGIDNIYSFELPEIVLAAEGTLKGADGQTPPRAFVRIVGSNGTNNKIRPSDDGIFGITLEKETDYIILCGAKGYANKKLTISTRGKGKSETLRLDVVLERVN